MDSLAVQTLMKMGPSASQAVVDRAMQLREALDLSAGDTMELIVKTCMFVSVSEQLLPVPPKVTTIG